VLTGIRDRSPIGDPLPLPPLQATPLSESDLLINAEGQPNIGSKLRAELASADSVDIICAFVICGPAYASSARRWLSSSARGGQIRVVTTTYMGATEKRAVDELVALGAEVRVAFDASTTKSHAKAWLLERRTGLSTAFVGSSNLSLPRCSMAGVERAALRSRCATHRRASPNVLREPLGLRALRLLRPRQGRRDARTRAARTQPTPTWRVIRDLAREPRRPPIPPTNNECSTRACSDSQPNLVPPPKQRRPPERKSQMFGIAGAGSKPVPATDVTGRSRVLEVAGAGLIHNPATVDGPQTGAVAHRVEESCLLKDPVSS
jgi:hypothetical protein